MNGNVELSMFVEGKRQVLKEVESSSSHTFFSMVSVYFLWSLLGAGVALTIFSTSTSHVRHMVVFKYKPDATPGQIAEVSEAFQSLTYKIPGIITFEHGDNISIEKKDQGFNHVYLLTFENASARDAYIPHPDHEKFGELLTRLNVVEDVFVVDFNSR
jgi:hypothetical protein